MLWLLKDIKLWHQVELCLGSLLSIAVKMPEETMVISDAAKSGDGTLANVGIKVGGKFKSPVNNQLFDSQEALDLHLKYLHDPKKQGNNLEEWKSSQRISAQFKVLCLHEGCRL